MGLLNASRGFLVKSSQTSLVECFSYEESQCALNYLAIKSSYGLDQISFLFTSSVFLKLFAKSNSFSGSKALWQESM